MSRTGLLALTLVLLGDDINTPVLTAHHLLEAYTKALPLETLVAMAPIE
jgi:hypothetical protein